jgi:hypothetical protein
LSGPRHLADADESREAAVLAEVLQLHPTGLTVDELIRLMGTDPSGAFGEVDNCRRAVQGLRRYGLLRLDGEVVAPTIAAVRCSELFDFP